jgi:hypothetical protein
MPNGNETLTQKEITPPERLGDDGEKKDRKEFTKAVLSHLGFQQIGSRWSTSGAKCGFTAQADIVP